MQGFCFVLVFCFIFELLWKRRSVQSTCVSCTFLSAPTLVATDVFAHSDHSILVIPLYLPSLPTTMGQIKIPYLRRKHQMFSIISQVHECEFLYSLTIFLTQCHPPFGLMVAGPKGDSLYGKVCSRDGEFKTWGHLPRPLTQDLSVEPPIHFMLKPNPTLVLMILLTGFFFPNCKLFQPNL